MNVQYINRIEEKETEHKKIIRETSMERERKREREEERKRESNHPNLHLLLQL